MGTRADFYVGRGEQAEWLGSIAYDGYTVAQSILESKTEEEFREAVASFLKIRMTRDPDAPSPEEAIRLAREKDPELTKELPDFLLDHYKPPMDATFPEDGWPWPWEDSNTTDYSYAFDGGVVWETCFGHGWYTQEQKEAFDKLHQAWDESDDEELEEPKPPWELPGDTKVQFPNMKDRQNVTFGKRSGLMVLTIKE